MTAVVTKLRDSFETTMKDVVKGTFHEVPEQLKGAWDRVLGQIRHGLGIEVATREELDVLSSRVDQLTARLDALMAELHAARQPEMRPDMRVEKPAEKQVEKHVEKAAEKPVAKVADKGRRATRK